MKSKVKTKASAHHVYDISDEQVYMVFDYETYSEADISSVGAWEYSLHPSTEILCIAFRLGTRRELLEGKTEEVLVGEGGPSFTKFVKALLNPDVKLVAHNAFFEIAITLNVFAKRLMYSLTYLQNIPITRWVCTAAMAASVGLPRNLEGATNAYGLRHTKDMVGYKLMLKLCKPRKPTKNNPNTRHDSIDDYSRLLDYCVHDTDAEVELFLTLPPMPESEMEFWRHDIAMNMRGFAVDRDFVLNAIDLAEDHRITMEQELRIITQGKLNSTRQTAATKKFLKEQGAVLPDLQSGTVTEVLAKKKLTPLAKRVLEIRRETGRSSVAKYVAFDLNSRSDGRARDTLNFYGAHTGRGSGNRVQPQNLFKRVIPQEDVDNYTNQIRDGWLEIKSKHTMPDVLASCIRSSIVAAENHFLLVGDFSTIEVRVLFWLAGHVDGLKAIRSGVDLYIEMAGRIYKIKPSELMMLYKAGDDKAFVMRQLGKKVVLGAGFGIGVGGEKFQRSCKQDGLDISLELSQRAVSAYRETHSPIPQFWKDIENAALKAMAAPGKTFRCGKLKWRKEKHWLMCKLPIGRRLYYYKPKVISMPTVYGDKPTLTYMSMNSMTKQYERVKTWGGKLTENVVQAVARDILYSAAVRVEKNIDARNVLTVHDEIVSETRDPKLLSEFLRLLEETPAWCQDLPIKAEGWCGTRYRK